MSSEIYAALGMQANPFPPGACKDFYFQTEATKRILDELFYGITARKGFLVLVGEVGLGKTSLLLQLLPRLEQAGIRSAWVFNTILNKTELLAAIAKDYGLAVPPAPHLAELLDTLHTFFLKVHKDGSNCAIVIDEAHLLDFQAMEVLRMLSHLDLGGEKQVQILLAGHGRIDQGIADTLPGQSQALGKGADHNGAGVQGQKRGHDSAVIGQETVRFVRDQEDVPVELPAFRGHDGG